jgi:3-phosphoshikimate 1-carboxyvinyltransferase
VGGSTTAPGDKSISHRALILTALAEGDCELLNLAPGADVRSTAHCLSALGAEIGLGQTTDSAHSVETAGSGAIVRGRGLDGLRAPEVSLDCGNSGTTMRLLSGVVAGAGIAAELDGDESLRRRPMRRVLEPLRSMGARAIGTAQSNGEEVAPLHFSAKQGLVGRDHHLRVASAQVKSCLLLAGLWAEGRTTVHEPQLSRDHTERMLRAFGASVEIAADGAISLEKPGAPLRSPTRLEVPGDPSSAAFILAAPLVVGYGEVEIRGVDVNPTRTGFLRVLERMGGVVQRIPEPDRAGDPVATLRVRGDVELRSTEVLPSEIPALIDEVPLLSVLAARAHGVTTIRGAGELRFKESDRIRQMAQGLSAMGTEVRELEDGLEIRGPASLRGAHIDSKDDHRIAMSFAIAGLAAEGETTIDGAQWVDISFPGFFQLLSRLTGGAVSLGDPG